MTETITIYKRQYPLPTLMTKRFMQVQQRIRDRQQIIQTGQYAKQKPKQFSLLKSWFGSHAAKKTQMQELSVDERFAVMKELMSEYVAMLGMLDTHKVQYERLLTQIGDDIRQLAAEKCQKIMQHDDRLAQLAQQAEVIEDHGAMQMINSQQAQLVQSIQLLGQAVLLITKKLYLFQKGLQQIEADQDLKRRIIEKNVKQLGLRYALYVSQKDLYELQKEVADMLKVALNFEELMRECFGPLQTLIEDVTDMDGAFAGAVDEIKDLTRLILNDAAGNVAVEALNASEEELLNFLLHSQMQRDQLADAVNQAWQADAEMQFDADLLPASAISVQQALDNLRTFLDVKLPVVTVQILASAETSLHIMTINFGGGVALEMVFIPGGTFLMGSPDGQGEKNEHPQHRVTLSPFYMAKTPITQAQWQSVMGKNPSKFKGDNRPVEQVSWNDAQEFVSRLRSITQRSLSGVEMTFSLPSEAQWEYACRAGTQTVYCFGDSDAGLEQYVWYSGNSGKQTHPVGEKSPNAFGLFDMHGNVWEWCLDWFMNSYPNESQENPQGPSSGKYRVLRGGAWSRNSTYCYSADRRKRGTAFRSFDLGMRVAAVLARTE